MRTGSADRMFQKSARHHPLTSSSNRVSNRPMGVRPASGYLLLVFAGSGTLFFVLLLTSGEDAPWVPAGGLATSLVLLVALGAREVMVRRASNRYRIDRSRPDQASKPEEAPERLQTSSIKSHSAALRAIQKHSLSADASSQHEAHLDAYRICKDYLVRTDEALRLHSMVTEKRVAMRAGQERVRSLQKHHMMEWARGASRDFTSEAQLRVRLSDKIEAATKALNVIGSALKVYPADEELLESEGAIRGFMASAQIAHWLELAERAAFRGHYRRAIDRYRDALFYASKGSIDDDDRAQTVKRIEQEISALRIRLRTPGPSEGVADTVSSKEKNA